MRHQKVLFVLTGHDRLGPADDASAEKTGFHLAEAARPWKVLTDAGYTVEFATPTGGKAPIDPSSRDLDDETNQTFLNDNAVSRALNNTAALNTLDIAGYDAIYFPGGHGTMWDLPENGDVASAIRTVYESGGIVAAVCHGPAALLNAKLSTGEYLVNGKTLSVFTDAEERAVEKADVVPFLLASELEKRGATIDSAGNFEAAISTEGRLITGQNPASAQGVGEAIRDQLRDRNREAA